MKPERWRQITAVFHDALEREPGSRSEFLDQACAGDPELRAEIDRLIASNRAAGSFGESPVAASSLEAGLAADDTEALTQPGSPVAGRRQPFLAITWMALVAVTLTFAYAAWLLVRDGTHITELGWRGTWRAGGFEVTRVDPRGPAAGRLGPGDRILTLNGVPPMYGPGILPQVRLLNPGDRYSLVFRRGAEWRQLRLQTRVGPDLLAICLTYYGIGLVWCGVGLFIGLMRPEKTLARLACVAGVATGIVYLEVGVIGSGPLWQPLHVVLGYHFLCRFPEDRAPTGFWKWSLVFFYACAAVPAASGLWLHGILLGAGLPVAAQWLNQHLAFMRLRTVLAVASMAVNLVMVLVVVHNYRRLRDEDLRRRVRWVFWGSVAALLPLLWWVCVFGYERLVGPASVPRFDTFVNATTTLIPIAIAYAVVKHRVLDIRVVVRRGLQYVLARRALQTAVGLPIVALAYTLVTNRHRTIAEVVTENTGYLFWIGAAAVALRFRRPLRLWLDRRFFREQLDREQILLGLLDEVGRLDSISELSRLVTAKLDAALHPKVMYLWYRDPREFAAASSSDPALTPPDFPSDGRWLGWLEARGAAAELPAPREAGLTTWEARWFAGREVSLIVPVLDGGDRLVGAVLLGEKKSEEPYAGSDRRLLEAIAKQMAVVRENLRLRARVSEEQRVRHEVLSRLDGRVSDLLKECPACGRCYEGDLDRCEADGQALTLTLPVARTLEGKYRLDRLIGRGGMGAVYEARDLRLGRAVAVKVLLGRAFGQQTALRRFRREARAAARVNHVNLVSLYDYGVLEGEGAYLVMERVHGETLRTELDRRKVLSPARAADWFDPLLAGIAAVHAEGIIHRDLKPANVIGRRDEGTGGLTVKILDLGLVKFKDSEALASGTVTVEGVAMGTLGYMSPEQRLGREVDQRTDLFAIGVMLVEALTGRRPFDGDPYAEISPSRPRQSWALPDSFPEARALNQALGRCLALAPADRFESAKALRAEVIPLLRSGARLEADPETEPPTP